MRVFVFRFFFPFLAALLSGVLLFLAFPVYDFGWLGWVCLVPLLVSVSGRKPLFALLLSYACGIVFFVGIFGWILEVPGYKATHHIVLAIYLGSYVSFFGLTVSFISVRKSIVHACFAAPFIWVSLEFVRSNLSFLALPWPLIGHSQYQTPAVIQIASLAGAYGVSFLVVAVNSAITITALLLLNKTLSSATGPSNKVPRGASLLLPAGVAVLLGLSIGYGKVALSNAAAGGEIKVSLLQGNIERDKKWNPRHAKEIMGVYEEMTKEAAKASPSLIIWPEAATPRSITIDRKLYSDVKEIARSVGIPLLIGSTHLHKIRGKGDQDLKYRNSAVLIEPEGEGESQRYDKILLLPFAEYIPMKETIPWPYLGIPDLGNYIAGKEFTVFEGPGFRFGAMICWESIFPDLARELVKRGAQVIVNITNEGWFGDAAPYQLLASNVFRAVENRVYLLRCANTGISCIIDPYGRVVDRVKDKDGRDILVRGVVTGTVVPLESKTMYTRFGDWLVWLSFAASAALGLMALVRKRPGRNRLLQGENSRPTKCGGISANPP